MTALTNYDKMAEQLFSYRGERLSENNNDLHEAKTLSNPIVVNGDSFIPRDAALIIDRPAGRV